VRRCGSLTIGGVFVQAIYKYANKIKSVGLDQRARGMAVGLDAGAPGNCLMIAGGTITRSAYLAHRLWPDERMVQTTIRSGLRVFRLHRRTPVDVVLFLKEFLHPPLAAPVIRSLPELRPAKDSEGLPLSAAPVDVTCNGPSRAHKMCIAKCSLHCVLIHGGRSDKHASGCCGRERGAGFAIAFVR
jgi:hypothetical protein